MNAIIRWIKSLWIPKNNPYCYEILSIEEMSNGTVRLHTKTCRFYSKMGIFDDSLTGYCGFMGEEVEDMCKICGYWDISEDEHGSEN